MAVKSSMMTRMFERSSTSVTSEVAVVAVHFPSLFRRFPDYWVWPSELLMDAENQGNILQLKIGAEHAAEESKKHNKTDTSLVSRETDKSNKFRFDKNTVPTTLRWESRDIFSYFYCPAQWRGGVDKNRTSS